MFKGKPKIYFGDGGFRGMSEIRRSGSVNSRPSIRKSPSVYVGGGMSVGVSTRTVLASGGIARGGVVQVKPTEKPKPVVVAVSSPKVEKKSDECIPPMDERGNGCNEKMTEKEERLADFLETAQEVKPKCDEAEKIAWRLKGVHATTTEKIAAEEVKNIEAELIGDEGIGERKVRESMMEMARETSGVLSELSVGEVEQQPKKKRRKRKGRKAKAEEAGAVELQLTGETAAAE